MALYISNNGAITQLDAFTALANGGTARFYTPAAAVPADADADNSADTLVLQITLNATAWAGATDADPGASAVINTTSATLAETGIGSENLVGYARIYTSGGACIQQDDDVDEAAARVVLSDKTISEGQEYSITSWTLTQPETA